MYLADSVQLGHPEQELAELGWHRRVIGRRVLLQGLHHFLLRVTDVLGFLQAGGICVSSERYARSTSVDTVCKLHLPEVSRTMTFMLTYS